MAINHNDVYDFLHGVRKHNGIDLISQPKMVNIHGRTYPTIGNNLSIDNVDGWGDLYIHIPHENGYLTEMHVFNPNTNPKPTKLEHPNHVTVNDVVPGTRKTQSGLIRPTFNFGTKGVNRTGPYSMDTAGNLEHTSTKDTTHIHKFLEHISGLPSPQGEALNMYGREGNGPIPRDKMHAVDLAESVGHLRELHIGITMPKGTEHHLAIADINARVNGPPRQGDKEYLYDIGSESLTGVPKEMRTKFGDVG